jgi:hypothetical protein
MTTHHRPTRSDQPIFTPRPARPIVLAHRNGPARRRVYDITTTPTRAELRTEIRAHRRTQALTARGRAGGSDCGPGSAPEAGSSP